MTSTCRTTHSMCWLLWPWFGKVKKTAPNHRSCLIRLQSRRPQWSWGPLKVGRNHTQLQTIKLFIPRMSLEGCIGTIRLTRHLTTMSPDKYRLLQARPPHRPLQQNKRRSWAWGCLFLKKESVAVHMRCNRPAPCC